MAAPDTSTEDPTVLHVLPSDLARGAQVHARALRDLLDGQGVRHRTLTIFSGTADVLQPDIAVGATSGALRRAGFDPMATLRVRTALRRNAPSLVVAHGSEALKYVVAARHRCPTVYHRIGTMAARGRTGPGLAFHRRLSAKADLVVCVSEAVAREARDLLHVPEDRVRVAPNGRDTSTFHPRDGARHGPVRLVFVGHLTATKRPGRFVEVVKDLDRRGLDVAGIVVGDGPLEADVRTSAAGSPIEVLGRRHDVAAVLRDADVFVFTSEPTGEGMPGVLIEAGLSGLPVVTTDVPGADEVVASGETGWVVPVEPLAPLVDACERLVVDDGSRRRMSSAARRRCSARFSIGASAAAWRAIVAEVLGRHPGGGSLPCASST